MVSHRLICVGTSIDPAATREFVVTDPATLQALADEGLRYGAVSRADRS